MKMTAGQLNHLCDICDPDEAQEGDGFPVPAVKPKVMWADVWAEILSVGGGEKVRGIQVEATADSLITIRYREGVKPKQYMLEKRTQRRFNIVKAGDLDGRKTWLTVQAKEVV